MSDQVTHNKQLAVMRAGLERSKFYRAFDALEVVRQLEQGTRKDGVTPKFDHQLSIARLVQTLEPHLLYPEETIAACFLHDLREDHGEWTHEMLKDRFGERIANAVWLLSKKTPGITKTYALYFREMAECPIASIVKPADRVHNLQTMQGVFDLAKQQAYVRDVSTWFYPLVKNAKRRHPRQFGAYENLKIILRIQCDMLQHIHAAQVAQ